MDFIDVVINRHLKSFTPIEKDEFKKALAKRLTTNRVGENPCDEVRKFVLRNLFAECRRLGIVTSSMRYNSHSKPKNSRRPNPEKKKRSSNKARRRKRKAETRAEMERPIRVVGRLYKPHTEKADETPWDNA